MNVSSLENCAFRKQQSKIGSIHWLASVMALLICLWIPIVAGADVIGPGSTSAIDTNGNPVTPLISQTTFEGQDVWHFDTGDYATGPMISTLAFTDIGPTSTNGNLLFEFSLMTTTADATGTGGSMFPDSFTVSVFDGSQTMTLLMIDRDGYTTDPFGTAPGHVIAGVNNDSSDLDYTFNADLRSLEGQTIDLYFDILGEDDGFISELYIGDDIRIEDSLIPEPGSIMLGLWGFALYALRRRMFR